VLSFIETRFCHCSTNCCLDSVYLFEPDSVSNSYSITFDVTGLLEQARHVVMPSIYLHLTTFQSPFADLYMVFNATLAPPQHPGLVIEYNHGGTWLPVPTAATRPLSCSPGASVFSSQRGLPLVHSCRCPVDRQLASQPACRRVRSWRCRFVTEFQSDCAHWLTFHVSAVSYLTLGQLVP
jgi:hypothetical protein